MIRSLKIIAPVLLLVTMFLAYAMRAGLASSRALRRAALIDHLTQLPNRAAFSAELDRRVSDRRPFALGLIDLDKFKSVNDTHGHPAGDELLKTVGQILKRVATPTDMVARLGGDEFAFLSDTREGAERLALGLQLELARPLTIGSNSLKSTASIGVALAEPGRSSKAVVAEADDDLYANKRRRVFEPDTAGLAPHAATPTRVVQC